MLFLLACKQNRILLDYVTLDNTKRNSATGRASQLSPSEYGCRTETPDRAVVDKPSTAFSFTPKAIQCTGPWFVVSMRKRWKGGEIYRSEKPRVVFIDLASAFAEAQRLLTKHPCEQYAVFECIGYVKNERMR